MPIPNSLPINMFHWDQSSSVLSQGMSTIRSSGFPVDLFQQLYKDADDVGFSIHSCSLSQVVRFYLESTDKDSKGRVTGWWFRPVLVDALKNPSVKNVSVLVINDQLPI